jgi:hypothetical protein
MLASSSYLNYLILTLSWPSPSGSCSSFLSSSAQSTCSLASDSLLLRLALGSRPVELRASPSTTDPVALSAVDAPMLPSLPRLPNAWSISFEFGRDESLRSSTTMRGCDTDSRSTSSSGVVSASDSGTDTIESVGSGVLSTCVLGDRAAFSMTPPSPPPVSICNTTFASAIWYQARICRVSNKQVLIVALSQSSLRTPCAIRSSASVRSTNGTGV